MPEYYWLSKKKQVIGRFNSRYSIVGNPDINDKIQLALAMVIDIIPPTKYKTRNTGNEIRDTKYGTS